MYGGLNPPVGAIEDIGVSIENTLEDTSPASTTPRWMRRWLLAAGIYNLLWGAWVILLPDSIFRMAGIEPLNYPQIWQCVGMIVGVYGIGYLIAARDPLRHWPIVLVGLLGKVFGPIGFAWSLWNGDLPPIFGVTILTNDLLWWVPFAVILWRALGESMRPNDPDEEPPLQPDAAMRAAIDQRGVSLLEHSESAPTLVLFLRHAGCTFCREALADLRDRRDSFSSAGTRLALVHMGEDRAAGEFFAGYGLGDTPRFSDPHCRLYRSFGLSRGSLLQLFGPSVWWRGVMAGLFGGHGVGRLAGDGFQMPGAFVVYRGRIVKAFKHRTAADRPDYAELATCPMPARG